MVFNCNTFSDSPACSFFPPSPVQCIFASLCLGSVCLLKNFVATELKQKGGKEKAAPITTTFHHFVAHFVFSPIHLRIDWLSNIAPSLKAGMGERGRVGGIHFAPNTQHLSAGLVLDAFWLRKSESSILKIVLPVANHHPARSLFGQRPHTGTTTKGRHFTRTHTR